MNSLSTLFWRVARFLFDRATAPDRTVHETTEYDSDQLKIHIFQTDKLTAHRGSVPAAMQARVIAHALDDIGINYRIVADTTQTYSPPVEKPGSSMKLYKWWDDNSPESAEHCNLLLTNAYGGGRAGLHDKNAVHGNGRTRWMADAVDECASSECDNLWGGLHEFCHSMGGRHSTPMLQDRPKMLIHDNMASIFKEQFT